MDKTKLIIDNLYLIIIGATISAIFLFVGAATYNVLTMITIGVFLNTFVVVVVIIIICWFIGLVTHTTMKKFNWME